MKFAYRLLICILFFALGGVVAFWETNLPSKMLYALEITLITMGCCFLLQKNPLSLKKFILVFCAGMLLAWLYLESGLLLRIVEIITFGTIFLIRLLLKRNNMDVSMEHYFRNYKSTWVVFLISVLLISYAYFNHYIDPDFAKLYFILAIICLSCKLSCREEVKLPKGVYWTMASLTVVYVLSFWIEINSFVYLVIGLLLSLLWVLISMIHTYRFFKVKNAV